jgi:hypothetical protein
VRSACARCVVGLTTMLAKASAVILSLMLLSACASREEIAARKVQADQVAQSQRETRCTSFGHQRGSTDYSKCLESLYLQDQQLVAAEEANRAARLQAAAQGLQQAGAALSAINPPPQPSPSFRCTTFGNTTTCN